MLPNSPDQNIFIIKSRAASLPEKKQDVNDFRLHVIDVRVRVEESIIDNGIERWRSSPCIYSSQRRTFWIFTV